MIQDCKVCGNEHFQPFPGSSYLWFRPDPEQFPDIFADDYPRLPPCCTSCWYIYESDRGLEILHGRCDAECEDVVLVDQETAKDWKPPEGCNHSEVALGAVRDWIAGGAAPPLT